MTPAVPGDITPTWLTAALAEAGELPSGRVTSAHWERIGQEHGFTGVIGRVDLTYEGETGNPPRTLIVKLPMAREDAVSAFRRRQERDPVLLERYYERCAREAQFYRELAVPFAPRHYYSAVDDDERRVVLLLEDVAGGRQGDVLEGCTVEEATLVLEALAPFHARWWGERAPRHGLSRPSADAPLVRQERYAKFVPHFLAAYGASIPAEVATVVEQLSSQLAAAVDALGARSQTLIHGDLHLDNMIFRAESVAVLDWQTVSVGAPAWDVAMFLVTSLDVDDRRAAEDELFSLYVSLLRSHGVSGYSVDDLALDCRLMLLSLLAGTVVWLTGLESAELTFRERALKAAALGNGRLISALLDHNAGDALATIRTT